MKMNTPSDIKLSLVRDAQGYLLKAEIMQDGKIRRVMSRRFTTQLEARQAYELLNRAMDDAEDAEVLTVVGRTLQ